MGLNRKFSTDILQTGDSCLMISFSIILNYYSYIGSDDIFKFFLEKNDSLFDKYNIDRGILKSLSMECRYIYLYYSVVKATNGSVQFSNEYISESLKGLTDQFLIDTEIVDIKKRSDEIKTTLMNEEACLSLSCHSDKFGWHATPIGFDTEFYTVHNGNYVDLGEDFMEIKTKFGANDIGDGILFKKRK